LSITKFRGCFTYAGPPIVILVGLVLIVGFLYRGQNRSNNVSAEQTAAMLGAPAFTLGSYDVYLGEFRQIFDNLRQQQLQTRSQSGVPAELTPADMLGFYAQALSELVDRAAVMNLAKQRHIDISDDDLAAFVLQMEKDNLNQQQQTFEMIKQFQISSAQQQLAKIKDPNSQAAKAANAQLEKIKAMSFELAFKSQSNGLTPEQYLAFVSDNMERRMADPLFKRSAAAGAAHKAMIDQFAAKVDVSDEALKRSYDKLQYIQIGIQGEGAKAKAEEVLEKIRGGLDFKAAAQEFSSLKDAKGDVNHDPITKSRFDLLSTSTYPPVLDLKPGEVSEVSASMGTAYIYKLLKVVQNVPKEFDSLKGSRLKDYRDRVAAAMMAKEDEKINTDAKKAIKWNDEGIKLLFDFSEFQSKQTDKAVRINTLNKFVADTQNASSELPDIPVLIRYLSLNQLDVEVPEGEAKKKIKSQLLETYGAVLDVAPSVNLRFQYIDELIKAGKGDLALDMLLDNMGAAYPAEAQTEPIVTKVEALLPKAANLATKGSPVVDNIQKEIKTWRTELKENAANKAAEEENRKENAKQEAELKKQEAAKKADSSKQPTPPKPIEKPKAPGG
jgi:hypothetical protein